MALKQETGMSASIQGLTLSDRGSVGKMKSDASPGLPEEAALFARFMQGEDTAAIRIFERYNSQLFLYCSKILSDIDQAEDVTQEIWERVLRLRAKPQEILNPTGFLFRIARNLCLNQMRVRYRAVPIDSVEEASLPSCTMPGASDMEELVLSSLEALRFEDRELLVLNVYCGYRLEEIAVMLEISPNAVWTRASRARAQLRTIMKSYLNSNDSKKVRKMSSKRSDSREELTR